MLKKGHIEVRRQYDPADGSVIGASVYIVTSWGDPVWATWTQHARDAEGEAWFEDALARARQELLRNPVH